MFQQPLKCFPQAKHHYEAIYYTSFCLKVNSCIKARMQWSDLQTIHDIIFVLGTQGWKKLLDKGFDSIVLDTDPSSSIVTEQLEDELIFGSEMKAIDRLVARFQFPLESAGADVGLIKGKFESVLSYAVHFISLTTTDYQSVWWRIFHSPNCKEQKNLLIFIQLATVCFICIKW